MMLVVDPSRALPVYEQVREQVRRMVASGTLLPGARLPTIRQLATDLGLAKGTIAKAYELLEADAVIHMNGRNGSFVLAITPASHPELAVGLAEAAEVLVVTAKQLGADEQAVLEAVRKIWARY